jgi:hypothetical protein
MDQETIQKIAAEIVKYLPSYPLMLLAVQTVLMLVAAALGTFFVEYFKTRGKHLATKADFDEVLSQLRTNTETVETIKSEVSQKDWAKREWTNLRRTKLEELLDQMHECEAYADGRRKQALENKMTEDADQDPVQRLQSLGTLYFPELEKQIGDYTLAHRNLMVSTMELARDVHRARADEQAYGAAVADFRLKWNNQIAGSLTAERELTTAARSLLVNIVGVES